MKHLALALVLAGGSAGCVGPFASDGKASLDESSLRRYVEYMAADSTFGRMAGSIHELRVATYIRDRFVENGLQPGAPEYFQEFPVVGGKFPVGTGCAQSPSRTGTGTLLSQNVIGMLPGTGGLAGQWVAVTAHYDHLGCIDETGGVVIYNGADDNASGTATMLELARSAAERESDLTGERRSVIFVAFGAEEPGLIGSRFFVANPAAPIDSIVAVVNLDMVGRLRDSRLTIAGTGAAQGWKAVLEAQNDDGLRLNYDDSYLMRGDHYGFILAATPAILFFTGSHADYHEPTDDVDLVDFSGMVTVGEFALRVVTALRISRTPVAN